MRRKIVAGNWKMNGSLKSNEALLDALKKASIPNNVDVIIFPPYPYLIQAQMNLQSSAIKAGAQNLSISEGGAFTGEIAGNMIKDIGCNYVLVGHSERRTLYGETSAIVAQKTAAAIKQQLTPVLCIGETLAEREAEQTQNVLTEQLQAVIEHCGIEIFSKLIIAYEPVWAIGTGKTASPEQAQAVHAFIRCFIAKSDAKIAALVQVLYGGSVKASSAKALFEMPDIDGGLVGGAALDATEFTAIISAAS